MSHFPHLLANHCASYFSNLINSPESKYENQTPKKMTNLQIRTEEPNNTETQTPLLTSNTNHQHEPEHEETNTKSDDTEVDKSLVRLESYLNFLGFNPRSILSSIICWSVFFTLGVVVPLVALWMCDCSECEKYELRGCEMVIVAFQASLAAVSLLCLSHCLRKYGLRRFLFVDRYTGHVACFHRDYVNQISVSQSSFATLMPNLSCLVVYIQIWKCFCYFTYLGFTIYVL